MTDEKLDQLKTAILERIGEGSVQWNPRPEGVFDSTGASEVASRLLAEVRAIYEHNFGTQAEPCYQAPPSAFEEQCSHAQ